ncbi:unnamed protein product [Coregonus sp. 'balchen']|nr:unnamed protein product [Coregonus sp. 'balchen']
MDKAPLSPLEGCVWPTSHG